MPYVQLIAKYCAIFALNIDKCIFGLLLVGSFKIEFKKSFHFTFHQHFDKIYFELELKVTITFAELLIVW